MAAVCAISLVEGHLIDHSSCKEVNGLNCLEGEIWWLHVIQGTIGPLVEFGRVR